jgi:hypothetical protein
MIILTIKERRLIDEAVFKFGNDYQRSIWSNWKQYHPEVRNGPSEPADDGAGRLPQNVVDIAVSALDQLRSAIRVQIDTHAVPDDEAADLCNDMAEINSISEVIRAA